MSQTIILYSHATGPNPWKVAIILEELGLKYEHKFVDMADMKKAPFEKLNPNGRVPAIEDPNTGMILWESGAIIEYLLEQYDKSNTLTFSSSPDKYYAKQYLHYQMSGQGPYFGQLAWFGHFHDEKLPSAKERYSNEVKRVTKVLDTVLSDKEYLVGGKCSYADLSFVPWFNMLPFLFEDEKLDVASDYPNYNAWMERLLARPAVRTVLEAKQAAIANSTH